MTKTLVAYFSASGTTAHAAKEIAEAIEADLYEICPIRPYTAADLDWNDKQSRSTAEMNDPTCRPDIAGAVKDMEQYDTVGRHILLQKKCSLLFLFISGVSGFVKKSV